MVSAGDIVTGTPNIIVVCCLHLDLKDMLNTKLQLEVSEIKDVIFPSRFHIHFDTY